MPCCVLCIYWTLKSNMLENDSRLHFPNYNCLYPHGFYLKIMAAIIILDILDRGQRGAPSEWLGDTRPLWPLSNIRSHSSGWEPASGCSVAHSSYHPLNFPSGSTVTAWQWLQCRTPRKDSIWVRVYFYRVLQSESYLSPEHKQPNL